MSQLRDKLTALMSTLDEGLVERTGVIKLSLLALIAQENLILIGPPGTAKSEVSRRLAQVIKDANYFEYLLTKFTTPEEIFGPLSIKDLKEGAYKRQTAGYIPTSCIVFLDEIFKANSAILNSLLTILNERVYHNGSEKQKVPLLSLISASNELPIGDEELGALYDRFLFRKYVDYVSEDNVNQLFHVTNKPFLLADDLKLSAEEVIEMGKEAQSVEIPQDIIDSIINIRMKIKDTFKENLDESFSDRRLVKILKILRVTAYTNERSEVNHSDLLLLAHCLWNDPKNETEINKIIRNEIVK